MTETLQRFQPSGVRGFPPISRPDATTLILGSMPGIESLAQQRYYAHPRNGFWPIVRDLFNLAGGSYEQTTRQLARHGIAVWDVLKSCVRSGSLDSGIDGSTIVANDFQKFYHEHPQIRRVFFNGAKAESIYLKHVLPCLEGASANLELKRLPSTSPAHASLGLEQKKEAWRILLGREAE